MNYTSIPEFFSKLKKNNFLTVSLPSTSSLSLPLVVLIEGEKGGTANVGDKKGMLVAAPPAGWDKNPSQ